MNKSCKIKLAFVKGEYYGCLQKKGGPVFNHHMLVIEKQTDYGLYEFGMFLGIYQNEPNITWYSPVEKLTDVVDFGYTKEEFDGVEFIQIEFKKILHEFAQQSDPYWHCGMMVQQLLNSILQNPLSPQTVDLINNLSPGFLFTMCSEDDTESHSNQQTKHIIKHMKKYEQIYLEKYGFPVEQGCRFGCEIL